MAVLGGGCQDDEAAAVGVEVDEGRMLGVGVVELLLKRLGQYARIVGLFGAIFGNCVELDAANVAQGMERRDLNGLTVHGPPAEVERGQRLVENVLPLAVDGGAGNGRGRAEVDV